MRWKIAAAAVTALFLLTAGLLYVSAGPPEDPSESIADMENRPENPGNDESGNQGDDGPEGSENAVPEDAYQIEPGYEEVTEEGVLHWYSPEQAENGILVTAAEGYLVSAELPEETGSGSEEGGAGSSEQGESSGTETEESDGNEPEEGPEPEDPLREYFREECSVPFDGEKLVFYVLLPDGTIGKVIREDRRIDGSSPKIAVSMNGKQDKDGWFYYRAENCGITVTVEDEGPVITTENIETEVKLDGVLCKTETFLENGKLIAKLSPETVIGRGDGEHALTVSAADAAGNFSGRPEEEKCSGVVLKDGAAGFVLDTIAPVCRFTVTSENAAKKNPDPLRKRFFFNSSFRAETIIQDENVDSERISVLRGAVTEGFYNTEKTDITAFPVRVGFSDTVTADGIYRYEISGTDKAGNPLVMEKSASVEDPDAAEAGMGRSIPIAVDTRAPEGTLSISAGGKSFYEMTADGTVLHAEPFQQADRAEIRLSADKKTERSPVMLSVRVDAKPDRYSVFESSASWQYNGSLTLQQSGRQEFAIPEFVLTDLAGNRTAGSVPHRIYLDTEPPEVDGLSPVIDITAENEGNAPASSGGKDAEGKPLFPGDVIFTVKARDPYPGQGSAGLESIRYVLLRNGSPAAEGVLWENHQNDLVFEAERKLRIPASDYEENDLKLVAYAEDQAGNETSRAYAFGIDRTSPEITVSVSGGEVRNKMYFSSERKAKITVREKNFDPAGIRVEAVRTQTQNEKNGGTGQGNTADQETTADPGTTPDRDPLADPETTVNWKKPGEDSSVWEAEILFSADGEYTLSVSGADRAGNAARTHFEGEAAGHFVIDRTPPKISAVCGDGEAGSGIFHRTAQIVRIEVLDANFNGKNTLYIRSGTDGEVQPVDQAFVRNTMDIPFEKDGQYALGGTVTDLAGNESEPLREEPFIIDCTPPVLTVEGVREWSANREPLTITVKIKDAYPDPQSLRAVLKALNADTETVFSWDGETDGEGILTLPEIKEDDLYYLTAAAADQAGNRVEAEVTFSENQKGTVFEFEQREVLGKYAPKGIRPSFLLHNVDEITALIVTVNGKEVPFEMEGNRLILRDPLREDGKYVIGIDAGDAAGNRNSMDPVEFFIDTAAPEVRIGGLDPTKTEYAEEFEITLGTEREEDYFRYVKLDGKLLFEGEEMRTVKVPPERFSGMKYGIRGKELYLRITEYGEHRLELQAEDPAGNVSVPEQYSFTLRRDVLERWTGEEPDHRLLYIISFMIPGAAVVPAAGWFRRKKKR